MKEFFNKYFYSTVKMFVNQFAIAIFGTALTFATTRAHVNSNSFDWLTLCVSIFSIAFYLFLIYTLTWEIGAKDRIHVDMGKKKYTPNLGLLLSLVANIPNIILALLYLIFDLSKVANGTFVVRLIASLLQGMFFGSIITLQLPFGEGGAWVQLNTLWPTFFIIVLPSMFTCWLAYYLGHKNFKFFPSADRSKNQGETPKRK